MLLSNYGNVLNRQGKHKSARDCFLEGIRVSQAISNVLVMAYLFDGLAGNMVLSGKAEEAALLIGASEGIFEAEGVTSMAAIDQVDHDYYLAEIQASLDKRVIHDLWAKGKGMPVEEIAAYILEVTGREADATMWLAD